MARLEQLATGASGIPESAPPATLNEQQIRIDERNRLSRELHDSTSQLLVAMQLRMAMLKHRLPSLEFCAALSELDNTIDEIHREIRAIVAGKEARNIAEACLPAALGEMAERFGRMAGMRVSMEVREPRALVSRPMKEALYRIAQEALANARHHGKADQVSIRLKSTDRGVFLSIEDDGVGISPTHKPGCGLANMSARAAALGGRIKVRRLARGTRISVGLPRHPAKD